MVAGQIIGGPHQFITSIEQQFKASGKGTFFSNQITVYKFGYSVNPVVPLLCATKTYLIDSTRQNLLVAQ